MRRPPRHERIMQRVTALIRRYPALADLPRDDVICIACETLGVNGQTAKDWMAKIQEQEDR